MFEPFLLEPPNHAGVGGGQGGGELLIAAADMYIAAWQSCFQLLLVAWQEVPARNLLVPYVD